MRKVRLLEKTGLAQSLKGICCIIWTLIVKRQLWFGESKVLAEEPASNKWQSWSQSYLGGGDVGEGCDEMWCLDSKLVWKQKREICFLANAGLELLVAAPEVSELNIQEFCKKVNRG